MELNNPATFDHIVETYAGANLKIAIIPTGVWNMDTTGQIDVAHGLTWTKIRHYGMLIWPDAGAPTQRTSIADGWNTGAPQLQVWVDATNISGFRTAVGTFDSVNYDDAVMNRGYFYIIYED